jgi:integrase
MKVVQELLGHATMEMTNRYSHLSPEVPRQAVKLLDGLGRVSELSGRQLGDKALLTS